MSKFAGYDPKMISIFEILGSFFTDILFNHIYSMAKTSSKASIPDEYIKHIQSYLTGIKNNEEHYNTTVQELYKYFVSTQLVQFATLKFPDFINLIVITCLPEDYYKQLTTQDKDDIFSNIICDLVANMSSFVTSSDILRAITIKHDQTPQKTIRAIQDCAILSLIDKRALLHNKFVKKVGQARDLVSTDHAEDMKKVIKKLLKEKSQLEADLEDADGEIDELKNKVHDYKDRIEDYKSKLEESKSREVKMRKLIELMQMKKEKGVTATANFIKQPLIDNIAEVDSIRNYKEATPQREFIAEASITSGVTSSFFKKPLALPLPIVKNPPHYHNERQQSPPHYQSPPRERQSPPNSPREDENIFKQYGELLNL